MEKKLRIAIVAPTEDAVLKPSQFRGYGGIERFVARLIAGLDQRGHEIHLFAPGNSISPAELHPTVPNSLRAELSDEDLQKHGGKLKMQAMGKAAREIDQLKPDIVHNNYAWRFIIASQKFAYAFLTTVHSDISVVQERETNARFKHVPFISISNDQRKRQPELNWVKTIYHGEDVSEYPMGKPEERTHFTFIGRTSPHKGLGDAIQAILKTDQVLKIAAKVGPDQESIDYFKAKVEPFVDDQQIVFLGEVGDAAKKELLRTSKGLLMLNDVSKWQEPFGLTATEAMAAGVPVIATRSGALVELIADKETGFLVDDVSSAHTYIQRIEELDPLTCRNRIESHFSLEKMVDEYENLFYEQVNAKT